MANDDARQVLEFWFGDAAHDPAAAAARQPFWFQGNAQTDALITARFGATIEAAARGGLAQWRESARGALAFVLVCDQFPRNVWRGTARAFSCDALALGAAHDAIATGALARLSPVEQAFLLLPLEHSEALADQRDCVARFEALLAASPAPWRELVEGWLRYAREHLALIERFGRFPHRNRVLGRPSTDAEREYLDGGGARFGQG